MRVSLDSGMTWRELDAPVLMEYDTVLVDADGEDMAAVLAINLNDEGVVLDVLVEGEVTTTGWQLVDDLVGLTR